MTKQRVHRNQWERESFSLADVREKPKVCVYVWEQMGRSIFRLFSRRFWWIYFSSFISHVLYLGMFCSVYQKTKQKKCLTCVKTGSVDGVGFPFWPVIDEFVQLFFNDMKVQIAYPFRWSNKSYEFGDCSTCRKNENTVNSGCNRISRKILWVNFDVGTHSLGSFLKLTSNFFVASKWASVSWGVL